MSREQSLGDQLLRLALENIGSHALVLIDSDGTIVGWYAGAQRLFGYTQEEVIGKNIAILFTPEDTAKHLSAWEIETASASGESEDDRWQMRKDGGRIWVSGTLTAVRDDQGRLVGFAKLMRNRTDQKSQLETIEKQVVAFKQADTRKSNFISTLAHELRSPVAAVLGATQLIQQSRSGDANVELATGILRRQADFMNRMIDDLLEVARTATGKVELHREPVVLQKIIRDAVETCRPSINERTQTLHQLLPEVDIRLEADRVRLRQVVINLIENAAKYTARGGAIWVKATLEGGEAVVRVLDNGVGIAPEVMPFIFDLFTQSEAATGPRGGLGIGLSVVKDTVTLHGGTVQATSDGLGKGSEFTVRLPLPDTGESTMRNDVGVKPDERRS